VLICHCSILSRLTCSIQLLTDQLNFNVQKLERQYRLFLLYSRRICLREYSVTLQFIGNQTTNILCVNGNGKQYLDIFDNIGIFMFTQTYSGHSC
jgi:hypothetical protein